MINTTTEEFVRLIDRIEDCNLEFKTAKTKFNYDYDLPDYCAALANERGGKLILGVTEGADKKGKVVGTSVFSGTHNKLSNKLFDKLGIRVDVEELYYEGKRVLIFHVPSRPVGQPIRSTGKNYYYPMRVGESLQEMDDQTFRNIILESAPDFSAKIVPDSGIGDLDPSAIVKLRHLCLSHMKNSNYKTCSDRQLLMDLGLMCNDKINYAGLVLLAKKEVLDSILPQTEIIFEWRQVSGKIAHDYRKSWREPFLKIIDEVWRELEGRNIRTPFQQGFFQREILAFDERSIREAVLNAVAHRDYNISGRCIFVTASPDGFLIESPGGFLPGITPENAIFNRAWRNQRLAEVLEKTGLVERSGQGLDLIFEQSIRSGKGRPDLLQSTSHEVKLFIPASLKDPDFVLFLEKITNEKQIVLSFEEMLELEDVRANGVVSKIEHAKKFLELGIIEKYGKTKDSRYMLAHAFYAHKGVKGVHTRLAGLKRSKFKELIVAHIQKNDKARIDEFCEAFPELPIITVQNLLRDLRKEGRLSFIGSRRKGYWTLKP
ncbi:MAG: putative DNA binding domain-containing protein [Nitrospinae bacterium]|nr:putative DNA binding domain-containing protein [Nitrospinota bacterium]